MQLSSLLLVIVPFTGIAMAECYGSGDTWLGYQGSILNLVRDSLCKGDSIGGSFGQDQAKHACVMLGEGIHADIEIRRKGGPADLSEDDCYFYLDREISACERGGWREYENWIFG
jgi:hypothetical protein